MKNGITLKELDIEVKECIDGTNLACYTASVSITELGG